MIFVLPQEGGEEAGAQRVAGGQVDGAHRHAADLDHLAGEEAPDDGGVDPGQRVVADDGNALGARHRGDQQEQEGQEK